MIVNDKIQYTPTRKLIRDDEFISDRIFDALCDIMPEYLNIYYSKFTTLQEVQRWLREEHQIYVYVDIVVFDDGDIGYESVQTYLGIDEDHECVESDDYEYKFTTYELALEDAIFCALEDLKARKQ